MESQPMNDILQKLCEYYEVTPSHIFRPGRDGDRVFMRQMFVQITYRLVPGVSFPQISNFIYGYVQHFYNHATHINSVKKVWERYEIYASFREEYDQVINRCRGHHFPKIIIQDVDLLDMCAKTF